MSKPVPLEKKTTLYDDPGQEPATIRDKIFSYSHLFPSIEIFAIGVGNGISDSGLLQISGSEEYILRMDDHGDDQRFLSQLH